MSKYKLEVAKTEFDEGLQALSANLEEMNDKVTRACAALSTVDKITNDEEDEEAKKLLVKVRNTYTLVQQKRKEITDPFDTMKAELMKIEKQIDTKKGSGSDYHRVKSARDKYANDKLKAQQVKEQEIRLRKLKDQEIIRVKGEMKLAVENGVFDAISNGNIQMMNRIAGSTFDTIQEIERQLKGYKPKLAQKLFEAWLDVRYDDKLISSIEFADIKTKARDHFKYEKVNLTYCEKVEESLKEFRQVTIPQRKIELEQIQAMSEEQKKLAMEQSRDDMLNEIEHKKQQDEKARIENIQQARDETEGEILDNEFEAQVALQDKEELSGVRKNVTYTLDAEATKKPILAIDLITKLMAKVLSHPDSKGFLQRDTSGFPKTDDNGRPIYVPGMAYWLKEAARLKIHEHEAIANLNVIEDVTTVAK